MKKELTVVFAALVLVSGASAAVIPGNITIDLNIDLFGDDKKEDKKNSEEKNKTYGKKVDGQSVYSETGPNNPPERRNSQEYGVTEDNPRQDKGFFSNLMKSLFG